MAGSFLWDPAGSPTAMLGSELNSLANNGAVSTVLSADYDNSTNLYMFADWELAVTFGGAATADATVDLYIAESIDGSNYGDGGSSVIIASSWRASFPMRAVAANRVMVQGVVLPPTHFKVYAVNASGQAFPASGSTIKMLPYREKYT